MMAIFLFAASVNALAAVNHACAFGELEMQFVTEGRNDFSVNIAKNGSKLATCDMKVTAYNDGKLTRGLAETTAFEKIACKLIDDKFDPALITDQGFIKKYTNEDYVSMIHNKQPLRCRFK